MKVTPTEFTKDSFDLTLGKYEGRLFKHRSAAGHNIWSVGVASLYDEGEHNIIFKSFLETDFERAAKYATSITMDQLDAAEEKTKAEAEENDDE